MSDIKEIMTADPNICTPLTSIEKLMANTNSKEIVVVDTIDHLVIVDEEGRLCGLYNPAGLLPIEQWIFT